MNNDLINELNNKIDAQDKIINTQVLEIARLEKAKKILLKDRKEAIDLFVEYKKRIDKAIENCKKSIESINQKLENNKEPFEVVDGKIICLNDYQVCRLKAIRMKCKELLEILGDKENRGE